ncbi:MAG: DUF559 domain-containing protein, partial [Sphingomonadales bacterium]
VAPARAGPRDRWMATQGFTVLRFTNDDVQGNVEGVATAICAEVGRLRGVKGER